MDHSDKFESCVRSAAAPCLSATLQKIPAAAEDGGHWRHGQVGSSRAADDDAELAVARMQRMNLAADGVLHLCCVHLQQRKRRRREVVHCASISARFNDYWPRASSRNFNLF